MIHFCRDKNVCILQSSYWSNFGICSKSLVLQWHWYWKSCSGFFFVLWHNVAPLWSSGHPWIETSTSFSTDFHLECGPSYCTLKLRSSSASDGPTTDAPTKHFLCVTNPKPLPACLYHQAECQACPDTTMQGEKKVRRNEETSAYLGVRKAQNGRPARSKATSHLTCDPQYCMYNWPGKQMQMDKDARVTWLLKKAQKQDNQASESVCKPTAGLSSPAHSTSRIIRQKVSSVLTFWCKDLLLLLSHTQERQNSSFNVTLYLMTISENLSCNTGLTCLLWPTRGGSNAVRLHCEIRGYRSTQTHKQCGGVRPDHEEHVKYMMWCIW